MPTFRDTNDTLIGKRILNYMHCQDSHLLRKKFTQWREVLRHGKGTSHCCVLAGTLLSLYSAACEDKNIFAQFLKRGLKAVLDFGQVSSSITDVFTAKILCRIGYLDK